MNILRTFSTLLILFFALQSQSQINDSVFNKIDIFLKQNVSSGLVDYSLIKADIKELNGIIEDISKLNPSKADEKKALLINLYNLAAIKALAENYPVNSTMEINGFYDKKFIKYNNSTYSLNNIENDILRKEFKDPRIHFVLVCGALGCPPITNFAYVPNEIDQQLNKQTILSLNNDDFLKIKNETKTVYLSEIFKWYEADFLKTDKNLIQFINKYRSETIPTTFNVDYYKYDWKINDIKITFATEMDPPLKVVSSPIKQPINTDTSISTNTTIPFDPREVVKDKKNTQDYSPSILYSKGQWEYKFFNNLYSQTKGYDKDGNKVKYSNRGSYFSSINQVLIGVNGRLNIGLDFWLKSVRIDDTTSSPFQLLSFENTPNSRTAFSSIGPKIKVQPFKNLSHLSIQTTFLFPIAKDQEGQFNGKPYLSADSYISITQVFYDLSISKKIQLFFQISPWVYIKQKSIPGASRYSVSSPVDAIFSFFPSDRLTFYVQEEFWPNFGANGIDSWFRQEGIGAKFQIIKGKLETEASYTRFSMGKSAGAGVTYNFGVRFIHL